MWPFIIRRTLYGIPILLGVTAIVFILFNLVAADPVATLLGKSATAEDMAALRRELGLDKSLFLQYLDYLKQIVTMDFGESYHTKQPVTQLLLDGAGPSISLTMPALLATTTLSVCVGLIASFFRGRIVDRGIMTLAVVGMSVSFLVYIVVLQYLLAFQLPLFNIHGYDGGALERWQFVILPIIIMVIVGMGYDSRFYRSVFVEEVTRDHVTTAYAKGASTVRVMFRHVLKNAMIPIITRVMISIPFLITGSVLLESFFGIPGMGNILLAALDRGDFAVIKAFTVMFSIVFIVTTIINDVLYAVVDPRVRLE